MTGERDRTLKRRATREARKLMRRGMAAGLVAIGACSGSHAPTPDAAIAGADASMGSGFQNAPFGNNTKLMPMSGATSDAGTAPAPDLSPDGVAFGKLARNVLYSWTTPKQIAELRADPILLTRSESSDGKRPHASMVIAALGAAGDPLGQVLASPKFQKGRYAWSNAWATVRGWPDESYGDQLLRIVLKPEAWIAVVTSDSIRVVDMNDAAIESSAALANPERIGAVFFMNQVGPNANACGTFSTFGCATGMYREYFINNESMVLEWSLGTQSVLDELNRSIELITAFRDYIAGQSQPLDDCSFSLDTYCDWQSWSVPTADSPPIYAYRMALALTSEFYTPNVVNMNTLLTVLKKCLFTPDGFEHKP